MMAWRIQPSLLLAFVARSPCLCLVGGNCLVSASVSKRCLSSCRQRSLLYFSLIHIYYRINLLSSDTLLSHSTRYSFSLIFSSRGNGGAKVCDAESLLSLLSLLYFSLIRVPHSIRSLMLPLLCRGSMHSLSLLIVLHILAIAAFLSYSTVAPISLSLYAGLCASERKSLRASWNQSSWGNKKDKEYRLKASVGVDAYIWWSKDKASHWSHFRVSQLLIIQQVEFWTCLSEKKDW
jgi:hypothetical protein